MWKVLCKVLPNIYKDIKENPHIPTITANILVLKMMRVCKLINSAIKKLNERTMKQHNGRI
jgi:hypothetical protein